MTISIPKPFRLILTLVLLLFYPAICLATDFDVIGLKLGMTIEEAKAALKKYNPEINIREKSLFFELSDGVKTIPSPNIITNIDAIDAATNEHLTLTFTAPPNEPRIVEIVRRVSGHHKTLPTIAEMRTALLSKYGEPTAEAKVYSQGTFAQTGFRWEFPEGKILCSAYIDGKTENANYNPLGIVGNIAQALTQNGFPDSTQCAKVLQISLSSQGENTPVTNFDTKMFDHSMAVAAQAKTYAWLDELEKKAKEERLSKGEAPTL